MAGLGSTSYNARVAGRQTSRPQSRPAVIAVLAGALILSGCSTVMMPLSGWGSAQNGPPAGEIATGSIPKPTVATPAPESDGDVIRRTVEQVARGTAVADPTGRLTWSNPTSGNSGTISDLVAAKASNGAPCRDFATTLATIEGVSMYRGRACQGYAGPWDLVDFAPAEVKPAG